MADYRDEPVVVIGLGRFGSALALELVERGTEVLAIDNQPKVVQALSSRITRVVAADTTDPQALRQLGVPDFYRGVVAIGTDIEASILTTSLLVELGVDEIWAKAVTTQHGQILDRIGAHHVVFPEHDMGVRAAHLVGGRMLDYIEMDENFALATIRPSRDVVGLALGESKVRTKYKVEVVAAKSPDGSFTSVTGQTVLTYDDIILISGPVDRVERFAALP